MKRVGMLLASIVIMLMVCTLPVNAAESEIGVSKGKIATNVGVTDTSVSVTYQKVPGGFANLSVLTSDATVAQCALTDNGNGTAKLIVTTTGIGSAAIAVFEVSNPAMVTYVSVESGLPTGNNSVTATENGMLVTYYRDMSIYYNPTLAGRNSAALQVKSLKVERKSNIDVLEVSGDLIASDQKFKNLSAFYANFYDVTGALIKRQAVYTGNPLSYKTVDLKWYIPDGTYMIVME